MSQTVGLSVAALKQLNIEAFRNQMITTMSPFYNEIKKTKVGSATFKTAADIGQNGGYGAPATDGITLPTAGAQKYMNFEGTLHNIIIPARITDKAVEASKSADGSYVGNLLTREIEGAFKTGKINLSRTIAAGNSTGILATTNDNTGSTSITVSNHRFLDLGLTIDVYQANGTLIGRRRIVGITRSRTDGTGVIVVDSTIDTIAATSFITIQDSYNGEISGIDTIFDDTVTSYLGNVKSATPAIVPTTFDAGQDVSNEMIGMAIAESDDYRNGHTNMILAGDKAYWAYANWLDSMKIAKQTAVLEGGFTALQFLYADRIIKIVREKFIVPTEMIGVNTEDFEELYLADWGYMEEQDSGKLTRVPGTDYYEVVIRKYAELICKNPGACWKLTNCA